MKYNGIICKGSIALGSGCGKCEKCKDEIAAGVVPYKPRPPVGKWDVRFLELADHVATWSKDPSTKIGAVVVGETPNLVAFGYNGFAPGVADTEQRLHNRDVKYNLVVHGEINALINAPFKPITLYVTQPPCIRCTAQILAYRSIRRVVFWEPSDDFLTRWDPTPSLDLLAEVGVTACPVGRTTKVVDK